MSTIACLEQQLGEAEGLLAQQRERSETLPDSLAHRLAYTSFASHVEDLQNQLRELRRARAVEVVELRLRGRRTTDGTIPLYLLTRIGSAVADAVVAASQHLKSGRLVKRISSAVAELVDLRLAELAPGSTRLFITGESAPDLLGFSLLDHSLSLTFQLLSAETDDDLSEAVAAVGLRSARGFRELLETLAAADLDLEMRWTDSHDEEKVWRADVSKMQKLNGHLSQFHSTETETVQVVANVIMLSLRGRFELQADGRILSGRFASDVIGSVQRIPVGAQVFATLERTVLVNSLTGLQKTGYTLVGIDLTGQEQLH